MRARAVLVALLCAYAAGAAAYGEMDVVAPNANGKLPEGRNPSKMTVSVAEPVKLGDSRRLVVVTAGDFAVRQLQALRLFDRVLSVEDAERIVIARGLDDRVLSLKDPVGHYMLAKHYQPYLLVSAHRNVRKNPGAMKWLVSDEHEQFVELRVTDPITAKVLFSAEIEEDYRWKGVTEKNTYYPLLNRLVDWVIASDGPLPQRQPLPEPALSTPPVDAAPTVPPTPRLPSPVAPKPFEPPPPAPPAPIEPPPPASPSLG
jgi:hypothetical protein